MGKKHKQSFITMPNLKLHVFLWIAYYFSDSPLKYSYKFYVNKFMAQPEDAVANVIFVLDAHFRMVLRIF